MAQRTTPTHTPTATPTATATPTSIRYCNTQRDANANAYTDRNADAYADSNANARLDANGNAYTYPHWRRHIVSPLRRRQRSRRRRSTHFHPTPTPTPTKRPFADPHVHTYPHTGNGPETLRAQSPVRRRNFPDRHTDTDTNAHVHN